ncbi:ferredoxin [Campylobacter hepaticus]|uniref:Ferredoxin n=1 Tax=Campylobacter hepaticus TaxID=1813019 RepID=A0A424Z342_9BACT|nr:4Fe-4S dicluster domain-containing protein [Campylobacter hepaticus]RQD68745.1 ferredoxin [Campylobacter hepaticus]RQD88700.1 ferredoxin [Campylobacter hepaticus]
MAVKITDSCIACGSYIDECPVNAIVDDVDNPENQERYYIYANKCVECIGYNDQPACASACPTDGCIVWSTIEPGQPGRDNINTQMRNENTAVFI